MDSLPGPKVSLLIGGDVGSNGGASGFLRRCFGLDVIDMGHDSIWEGFDIRPHKLDTVPARISDVALHDAVRERSDISSVFTDDTPIDGAVPHRLEIIDDQREVLVLRFPISSFDEVELLIAELQPGIGRAEIRRWHSLHIEEVRVKRYSLLEVVHIDGYMVE